MEEVQINRTGTLEWHLRTHQIKLLTEPLWRYFLAVSTQDEDDAYEMGKKGQSKT